MALRRTAGLAALCASIAHAAPAAAQEEGFSLNRFDPSERGSDWFASESLDFRQGKRLAIGVVGDWSHNPLVFYDENGDEVSALVKDQVFVHVGASYLINDRLRLSLNLPLAVINSGEGFQIQNQSFSTDEGATVGDARLSGDVRLFGEYGDAATGAVGLAVYLPTGSRDAFTGDGKVRLVVPRFMLSGDVGAFTYAAKAGFNFRAQNENFNGEPFGSEVVFSLAAGVRAADGNLVIGPELYGSTVVSDSGDGFFARRTTPVEAIFGGHYRAGDWKFGLGAGPGLTRGIGSPEVRVLASIEFFPEPKKEEEPPPPEGPKDTDGDGIYDPDDACPETPGVASDDPEKHGCPLPGDRDNDGVLDEDDACPDTPGEKTDDPETNGCPPPDRDKDGILDRDDACPDEPGVKSDDPEKNGCPPPKDSDGDGILDPDDDCPDQAGPAGPPGKNGCPKAKIVGKEIKILERVEFDTAKATIRPESEGVLNAVLDILNKHPEITLISVEGHTDNRGARGYNTALSRRRAASVVKWLVGKGIDRNRMTSKGFGPTKPIDTNNTAEGRQNNRRVEFHIKKTKGKLKTEVKQGE